MEIREKSERGKMFKKLRIEKCWTQEELAMNADISSVKAIENLEKGVGDVSTVDFLKICLALRIENPDDIIYK